MKTIAGVKAVFFDADGTLWDFDKVMRQSLALTIKELENHVPSMIGKLSIAKMIGIRNRVSEELRGKINNHERVRFEAFKQTLAEIGHPDDNLASYLSGFYLRHRFEDIELFSDVEPTLNVLRSRYTLGLVSNGNSYPDRCGLAGMFSFVVFSEDYDVEKPDPRFYRIAIEKSGYAPREILHVGDSIKNDIVGATGAGIRTAWLNRNKAKIDPEVNIEYEIASLSELLDILGVK